MKSAAQDYLELKKFLGHFFDGYFPGLSLPPEAHPLNVLEEMERRSASAARRGLTIAINDCLEMMGDWSPQKIAAFDADLQANGIVSLSTLHRHNSRLLQSILKRGHIKTEVEYYLVRGAAEHPSNSDDEAAILWGLLDKFEARAGRKTKARRSHA